MSAPPAVTPSAPSIDDTTKYAPDAATNDDARPNAARVALRKQAARPDGHPRVGRRRGRPARFEPADRADARGRPAEPRWRLPIPRAPGRARTFASGQLSSR